MYIRSSFREKVFSLLCIYIRHNKGFEFSDCLVSIGIYRRIEQCVENLTLHDIFAQFHPSLKALSKYDAIAASFERAIALIQQSVQSWVAIVKKQGCFAFYTLLLRQATQQDVPPAPRSAQSPLRLPRLFHYGYGAQGSRHAAGIWLLRFDFFGGIAPQTPNRRPCAPPLCKK